MKLNLGCGDFVFSDVINCDLYSPKADVRCDAKYLPFKADSIDDIYASHLIEHFDFYEAFEVLKEWKRVLKPDGVLRIETPDLLKICKKFVESDEPERWSLYGQFFAYPWIKGQSHKFLYTEPQLWWTLDSVGFRQIATFPALRYIDLQDICLGMGAIK